MAMLGFSEGGGCEYPERLYLGEHAQEPIVAGVRQAALVGVGALAAGGALMWALRRKNQNGRRSQHEKERLNIS